MSTSISSSTTYATIAQLIVYHDTRQLKQLVNDSGSIEADISANATITAHLNAASGMVEAYALRGNRYTPTDLGTTLTGVSKENLVHLVCELAYWSLYSRRHPGTEMTPAAIWAFQTLEALAEGKEVFALQEAADAGNPTYSYYVSPSDYNTLGLATDQARRYFGKRAKHNRPIS